MKNYETPKMELMELSECDILTASNGTPLLPLRHRYAAYDGPLA